MEEEVSTKSRARPVPEAKKYQVSEINQPTAVIEIETTSGNDVVPKKVIHFEMSTEQMAIALMQMEAIQKAIDNASQ